MIHMNETLICTYKMYKLNIHLTYIIIVCVFFWEKDHATVYHGHFTTTATDFNTLLK